MKTLLTIGLMTLLFNPLVSQEWQTDFAKAKKLAAEKNIPIILVFQGSDWCAPCIKLDKEIWSSEEFKAYAEEHYIMLKADFPRKKGNQLPEDLSNQNKKLAEQYNPNGYFPHVVILSENGEVLGRGGYEKISPMQYIEKINAFL